MRTRPERGEPLRDERVWIGVGLTIVIAALVAVGSPSVAAAAPTTAHAATVPALPELAITPPNVWTTSGNATNLTAVWSGGAPGCSLVPLWYHWSLPTPAGVGMLLGVDLPSPAFFADAERSGRAIVSLVAAAGVTCGTSTWSVVRWANATVRVDAPLALRDVAVLPNPVPANQTASLGGTIVGGEPPYNVTVAWGDGLLSTVVVPSPGPFAIAQRLPPGNFRPSVTAFDSVGTEVRGTAAASVVATAGYAIGIFPASETVDVATPLRIVVVPYGPYQTIAVSLDCGNGESGIPGSEGGFLSFLCVYESPGTEYVSALASGDGTSGSENVTATLSESVVADPTLTALPAATDAELGEPFAPLVELSGGVPPYIVDWRIVATDVNASDTVEFDGLLPFVADPGVAGSESVEVGVTDAVGSVTASLSIVEQVATPLSVSAVASGDVENLTPTLRISAGISGGAAPFDWAVESVAANTSVAGGVLNGPGTLAWNGSGSGEGPLAAELFVVDAAGVVATENLSATPIPPLSLGPLALGVDGGNWTLAAPLTGGVPPYRVWVNDSDGFLWNGSTVAPGPLDLAAPVPVGPAVTFSVVVTDADGGNARTNATLLLPAPLPSSSSSEIEPVVLIGVALAGVAIAFALGRHVRKRRHDSTRPPPPIDTAAVLRRLIEPVDGVDRATVELLAAEEGAAPEEVRRTLDRLIEERRVRAGRGSDGEEILAWEIPL